MIIKEAEKKYGKKLAMLIWENFDLENVSVNDTPDGLDIPNYEWETIYRNLLL